jgi:predicted transcriptional regulator
MTSLKPCRLTSSYRDRIYIIKDIILKLTEYGELNQTNLLSFCGLNPVKHRDILDEMERKGILTRSEEHRGNKTVTIYRVTERGKQFCEMILEPYEKMFPRKTKRYNKVTEHF